MTSKFSLILFCSLFAFTQSSWGFHIILDPGHGGVDTGAVHGPLKEADLVLKVSQKVRGLLEKNSDFHVTMTRTSDHNIALPERVKLAEQAKADLFVSLHANAATDPRAHGVELFFQNNLPPDEDSMYLANQENQAQATHVAAVEENDGGDISKKGDISAIVEDLHRQNRMMNSLTLTKNLNHEWHADSSAAQSTIKQAPFYVISKTTMPSVLIEIGFLTNPREAKKLLDNDYQNNLAEKIYAALVSYKEKMDKNTTKNLN
jgi:N-acetylmuramoyl-L-alanine amidase